MNWLCRACSSSVGKKILMAITGLLLCGFLVFHLAGNCLLYVSDDAYNAYAHQLHSQKILLLLAECGLATLFLAHFYLAFSTWKVNTAARKQSYNIKQTKQAHGKIFNADNWMVLSGVIVLAFLLLHLSDFAWELRPDVSYEGVEPADKARMILNTPLSSIAYMVATLILGAHLSHGISSAFQTLGANHSKYNTVIRFLGVILALALGLGFFTFPLWAKGLLS